MDTETRHGTYVGNLGILQEFPRVFELQCLVSWIDMFKVREGWVLDAVVKVREESCVFVFGGRVFCVGSWGGLRAEAERFERGEGFGSGGHFVIVAVDQLKSQSEAGLR
jgi:hypothetical protein